MCRSSNVWSCFIPPNVISSCSLSHSANEKETLRNIPHHTDVTCDLKSRRSILVIEKLSPPPKKSKLRYIHVGLKVL